MAIDVSIKPANISSNDFKYRELNAPSSSG
jgi:hypothetical protein